MKATTEFSTWIGKMDRSLRIRIDQRLQRLSHGNPGNHKRFDGLLEIKWSHGSLGSFRVYCTEIKGVILILGGHKGSQKKDIKNSLMLLEGIKNGKIRVEEYEKL